MKIEMTEYTLVRSHRKTIAIHITKEANVEVRAPLTMPKAEIECFVKEKQNWIQKHVKDRERINEQKRKFKLDYGHMVTIQGKEYPIISKTGNKIGFDGQCVYLPPDLHQDRVKYAVTQVYRFVAEQVLQGKVISYSKHMGLIPTSVRITSAKTRWGSCSGKNRLNFSWRLLMADDEVIDYVVVHELAHIKEHNHSSRFWAVVEGVLPDFKEREAKLTELQQQLILEDWD